MLVFLFTHPWCGLWLNFEVLQNIDRKCLSGGYCRFLLKYQLFDFCLGVDFYHFNWNIILYSSASLCILIHINVFQKVNRIHMMRLNLIFFKLFIWPRIQYKARLHRKGTLYKSGSLYWPCSNDKRFFFLTLYAVHMFTSAHCSVLLFNVDIVFMWCI